MTRHQIFLAFLYFFVVLIVLPILCSEKVYSVYYQENVETNSYIDSINNEHRIEGVQEYLLRTDPKASLTFYESKLSGSVDNLVIVIAKKPAHEENLTLTQLVAEIDRNIRNQKFFRNAMLICNATRIPFPELEYLARFYPVRLVENTTSWKLLNSEEVKKHDFVECARLGLNSVNFKHVTLIRDVVIPYPGFLGVVNHMISNRLNSGIVRGELQETNTSWLFMHLHEPSPLRHYQFSGDSLREILLLTCSGALLFYVVFRWLEGPLQSSSSRVTYTIYGGLYFITFALFIGRPYISELRRVAADMYRVYDPPEPINFSAMALPKSSLHGLLAQLSLLRCSLYSPFHEVLDHMVNTLELPGYVISPSLVRYAARA
nr:uncharacterized protein LOC123758684 [Procambarus clarkii]XP_045599180.1 uncharacterized protein LOC123758684 [Procambarus clarkii]